MKLTQLAPQSPDAAFPSAAHRQLGQAEFYRAEATRLRDMASSSAYREVRQGMLCVAREYELLADQRDELGHHRFGEPFRRPEIPDA